MNCLSVGTYIHGPSLPVIIITSITYQLSWGRLTMTGGTKRRNVKRSSSTPWPTLPCLRHSPFASHGSLTRSRPWCSASHVVIRLLIARKNKSENAISSANDRVETGANKTRVVMAFECAALHVASPEKSRTTIPDQRRFGPRENRPVDP